MQKMMFILLISIEEQPGASSLKVAVQIKMFSVVLFKKQMIASYFLQEPKFKHIRSSKIKHFSPTN
jgi:hypothetical protein